MAKRTKRNSIEINGRRYDAATGEPLDGAPKNHAPRDVHKPTHHSPKPPPHHRSHRTAKHHPSHAPTPSHTLMRQSVAPPHPKRRLKAQGHSDTHATPLAKVSVKPSVLKLDESRIRHAKQIPKSRFISHFLPPSMTTFQPVRPVHHKAPARPHQGGSHSAFKRPKSTADLLEHVLQNATSFRELPAHKSQRRAKRNAGISSAILVAVLLFGFVVIQNLSNVRLQIASSKAGFNATLPSYQPSGYSLGQVASAKGVVATQFHSNSDSRQYTITQKPSPWDSRTLRDNYVSFNNPRYQAVQEAGRTIYIYQNNATWVSGGIWYVVQTNGSLTNRQIVDLATSV